MFVRSLAVARSGNRSYATKVGVIGSGQMGTGIAKVAITQAKLPVLLMDKDAKALEKAHKFIGKCATWPCSLCPKMTCLLVNSASKRSLKKWPKRLKAVWYS